MSITKTEAREYGGGAVEDCSQHLCDGCMYIQLARQGLNVVIMSRSKEKLQKVADTIGKDCCPQC